MTVDEFQEITSKLTVQTPAPGDMPALWQLTYDEYQALRAIWHGGA